MWACALVLVTATTICCVSSVNFWPPDEVQVVSSPYWADDNHAGMPVQCSSRARYCLTMNQLLHEPSNTCYDLGAREPCTENGGTLVLDKDAFQMGRLRTYCRPLDECEKKGGYTMAYDGKCFTLDDIIRMKLCPNSPKIVPHPFGRSECLPSIFQKKFESSKINEEHRHCIMRNLRNERFWPWVRCNAHESECLRSNKLPYLNDCYYPLSRIPCPDGQFLIYDESAAKEGNLRASCAYQRPCGFHAHLFREDKSCHSEEELRDICKGGVLFLTPSGDVSCSKAGAYLELNGEEKKPGVCQVSFSFYFAYVHRSSAAYCAVHNLGYCEREVITVKPSIILEPEE